MKKGILILILLILALFSVSGIYASDVNDTLAASEDNLEIDQPTDDLIGMGEDTNLASFEENEILTEGEQTFANLNTTINGNTDKDIYLNGNYKYSNGDDDFKGGIVIDRDVNIYGNGHTINGSGEARIFYITGGNVVFYNITFVNANADNGYYDGGGAIYGVCRAINCTFKENHVNYNGGAMAWGSAVNCAFFGNSANSAGGAMRGGSAVNCTFSGNTVLFNGGAIAETCAVNCTFTNNSARYYGGAMVYGSAVNCTFTNNSAGYYGGAIYIGSAVNCAFFGNSANKGRAMDTGYKFDCRGTDDFSNTENLELHWEVDNFNSTYGSDKTLPIKLMNQNSYYDDWVWVGFINYDVVIYKNGNKVKTYHCLSNDDLSFDLAFGNYTAELIVTYPGLNQLNPKNITLTINKATPKIEVSASNATYPNDVVVNVKSDVSGEYIVKVGDVSENVILVAGEAKNVSFIGLAANESGYNINVTYGFTENYTDAFNDSKTVRVKKGNVMITVPEVTAVYNTNKDIIITLKDCNNKPVSGVNVTIDLDGAKNYTTDSKGQVKIPTKGLAVNTYKVSITFNGTENYINSSKTTTVTILKEAVKISTKPLTTTYNVHKYLVIALKDNNGNPIRNVDASFTINGVTYKCRSDSKGDARLIIRLAPKTYTAKITFDNANYSHLIQYVKVTVLKAAPKLTAKKKTFKANKKVKKYTATLKDNKGKAIKKAKITIKIGKKTYKAKTSSKGKAVFKIKALTKKGKYAAKITYKGNYLYKKVTKKVKITIK